MVLELADWRRRVAELYASIRADDQPDRGHATWRNGRDALFRDHPQSPLASGHSLRDTGLPYWPYNPDYRWELPLLAADSEQLILPTDGDGNTRLDLIGRVELPAPIETAVDVWWLRQYAGGIFLPIRDGTAGTESYGGGRYLLDAAKSADLGGDPSRLVIDLNFLYHPSCRYDPAWQCPLAPRGNTFSSPVRAGERM